MLDKKIILEKKGEKSVEIALWQALENWREIFAQNLTAQNPDISETLLNEIVQKTLDRLVFLRICEDRGLETYGKLQETLWFSDPPSPPFKRGEFSDSPLLKGGEGGFVSNPNSYLFQYFTEAHQKYPIGLFDLSKDESSKFLIDKATFETIIGEMYPPKSSFDFAQISPEMLGNVYEQFLGKTIKTSQNEIEIAEKPQIRKAGGVYYTPPYIVEYIVRNTLGKKIEELEKQQPTQTLPEREGLVEEVSQIKICDPACGSGAFLLGTYQFLLKWYLDFYLKHSNTIFKKNGIAEPLNQNQKLTLEEKIRILQTHIYGVDLDKNAVEVSKISLLLKALEGETADSIKEGIQLDLDQNIRHANSLIDADFYKNPIGFENNDSPKTPFLGNFLRKFDIILGNPPYGAELDKVSQKYFNAKYNIGTTDTAALFMVRTQEMLPSGGICGFIVPKAFTYASNWQKTRKLLLPDLSQMVDCSRVWKAVNLEMVIYLSTKNSQISYFDSFILKNQEIIEIGKVEKKLCEEFNFILNGVTEQEIAIGLKMRQERRNFNDIITNKRGAGLQKELSSEGDSYALGGKNIGRYRFGTNLEKKVLKTQVLDHKAFIKPNSILVQNIVSFVKNPTDCVQIRACLPTTTENYVILDTINQLENQSDYDIRFILAVLNSQIVSWYAYHFILAHATMTMHFDSPVTQKIPFPDLDLGTKEDKIRHDQIVEAVTKLLAFAPENTNEHIQSLENQINTWIEELYGVRNL